MVHFSIKVEKEILELYKDNDNVVVYYTKLKRLWDELDDLSKVPICNYTHQANCTIVKKCKVLEWRQRLMHSLIRLNDAHESIREPILLMDPFPNVSRAYCMKLRVKTQRNVVGSYWGGP